MRDVTIAAYLTCVVLAAALASGAHLPRSPFAPVGEVLDGVLGGRAARVALIVFWWWLGWHFLVARTVDPALG